MVGANWFGVCTNRQELCRGAKASPNISLAKISIGENNGTDQGAVALAGAASAVASLVDVDFSNNAVSDVGVIAFAACIFPTIAASSNREAHARSSIEKLCLAGNPNIGVRGLKALADAVGHRNSTLRVLDLGGIPAVTRVVQHFSNSLKMNPPLVSLIIPQVDNLESIRMLATALQSNVNLQELRVCGSQKLDRLATGGSFSLPLREAYRDISRVCAVNRRVGKCTFEPTNLIQSRAGSASTHDFPSSETLPLIDCHEGGNIGNKGHADGRGGSIAPESIHRQVDGGQTQRNSDMYQLKSLWVSISALDLFCVFLVPLPLWMVSLYITTLTLAGGFPHRSIAAFASHREARVRC